MHNRHSLVFLSVQGKKNLEGLERKTKAGSRRGNSYEFAWLTEEVTLLSLTPDHWLCSSLTFPKIRASCLDLTHAADSCCRLWPFVPVISGRDGELGAMLWSLSSIRYSSVGTDGFIFTRFPWTVLKTRRGITSVLAEMSYFVLPFHFLPCHFLWSAGVVQWFTFLGGFNSSVAVPSSS